MAKVSKVSRRKTASRAGTAPQAESTHGSLSESAQQIWLAGVGAFGRAQAEGTRLFDALVKEGASFEQTARKLAGGRADAVRVAMESSVGHARERAADTWDRLEKMFEDRVQRALDRLGVPSRDDLDHLAERIDVLSAELREAKAAAPRTRSGKPATAKVATRKTGTSGNKTATRKSLARGKV